MAMTAAEKMRAYRLRKQEAGFKQVNRWAKPGDAPAKPDNDAESRHARREAELQSEKLKAARAEARRIERHKDKSRNNGRIEGICETAAFLLRKHRKDIAQILLANFYIDRETAEAALQEDKRTKSLTLNSLDKGGAWEKPPPLTSW
jgi:hypothetical protein